MKKLLTVICLILSMIGYSQNKSLQRSFLLYFFQENILIVEDKQNKRIYDIDQLNIKIDTLGQYGSNILICKFSLGTNKIKSVDENLKISFRSSSCTEYVVAYDVESEQTYRLQGFNVNDLLFLIKSINLYIYEKKSVKKVLTELNNLNLGLDFLAIYQALQKLDFEEECLKVCSDGKPAHSR